MEPFWLAELVEGIVQLAAQLHEGARGEVVLVPAARPASLPPGVARTATSRLLYFEHARASREHVLEGLCIVPWARARSDVPHLHVLTELRRAIVWTRGETDIAVSAACFDGEEIHAEVRVALFDAVKARASRR